MTRTYPNPEFLYGEVIENIQILRQPRLGQDGNDSNIITYRIICRNSYKQKFNKKKIQIKIVG